MLRSLSLILLTLSLLLSCKTSKRANHARVKTDLGQSNSEIAARFDRYKAKQSHCVIDKSADFRVILAGFGPFSGRPVNTSGLIAYNFARFSQSDSAQPEIPTLTDRDYDGLVRQDTVLIEGKKVAVCAIVASVLWDLAGAIYLYEANAFRPDLIIMSGMDGKNPYLGTWESRARNLALGSSGYEHDGSESAVTPDTGGGGTLIPIIPGGPDSLSMRWAGDELSLMANEILSRDLPEFSTHSPPRHTPGTYLCNNVSYVVLAGLDGIELSLAGGMMRVDARAASETKAGFFHYPWDSPQDRQAVGAWSRVMRDAIKTILKI